LTADLDIHTAYLGIVVQTTSALLLAATFIALRRFASGRADVRDWSHAFLALSIALGAIYLTYELTERRSSAVWADSQLVRTVLATLYQAGKFAFFALLLIGARRFAGREPPIRPALAVAGLAGVAVVSTVFLTELNTVVTAQAPFAIACCVAAAREMRATPTERRSFGSRATGVVFLLLAVLWLFYLVSFAMLMWRGTGHYPALVTAIGRYNSYIDVLLQSALGFALVITLFQDLERDAEAARTERAELQARLAVAQKLEALGVLVSGVAHELNNPLTSILGFSDVVGGDPRLPADLREPLHTISEQAHRCRTIVRGLLDAARQRRAPRTLTSLAGVVGRVVRGMTPQLSKARVVVVNELIARDVDVPADPTGLEQVFSNLLSNALDALPDGGCVRISARQAPDERVVVRMEDDGPGIPAELRQRIFEPFFTTKGGRSSTGLGLAISQRILQAHGGTLALVERDDDQRGAAFDLSLPRYGTHHGDPGTFPIPPDPAASTPLPAGDADDPPTDIVGKPRVLVVDDEKPVRELLLRWLRQRGWSVQLAGDGREALALLRSNLRIDMVVTDLRMPGMTGMELFDQIAANYPQLAARTIAITGDALSPDVANFVRRRACLVLEKPLDFARLADELARCVGTVPTTPSPAGRSPAASG